MSIPGGTFNLAYAVNSIAMPVIGGMTTWGWPGLGRDPARHAAAMGDGDDLAAWNLLDRRRSARPLRHLGAQRHGRLFQSLTRGKPRG